MGIVQIAKTVLKAPMFQPLYRILRDIPGRPNIAKHLPARGVFEIPCGDSSFKMMHYGYSIENDVFWGGLDASQERLSLRLWIEAAKRATTIFDVGANTGIYALTAQAANRAAHIYAFEPIPRIFDKLERNCALNDYPIICSKVALSDHNGVAIIHDSENEHIYGATFSQPNIEHWTSIVAKEVEIARADTYMYARNIYKVDLVKLDVECHESEVIRGLGRFFDDNRPTFLIEVVEDRIVDDLRSLFRGKDYLFFDVNESSGTIMIDDIRKSSSFNLFVCQNNVAKDLGLIS